MSRSAGRTALQIGLGCLLGGLLAWFLFRDTDWRAIGATFREAYLPWIVLSQVFLWSSHLFRVQRWACVIRASQPTRYRAIFSAAQLGFLLNVTLPLRLGEGGRVLLLSRLAKIRLSTSAAMVALDRVGDAAALILTALVALVAFPAGRDIVLPPGTFRSTEPYTVSGALLRPLTLSFTVLFAALLSGLILLYARRSFFLELMGRRWTWLPAGLTAKVRAAMSGFVAGMQLFESRPQMWKTLFLSLLAWGCGVLSLTATLKAFPIKFAWYVPFAMQAMIALFASAPLAPGLIGQFHFAVIACLLIAVPEVTLPETKAIALATHFLALIPILALGLYALLLERANILALPRPALKSKD